MCRRLRGRWIEYFVSEVSFVHINLVRSYVVRLFGSPLGLVVITVQGPIRNFVVSFVRFVSWPIVVVERGFVDTVVLAVDDHRECSGFPCSLRKVTRYEFLRYVAAGFPRCFVVTVPLNLLKCVSSEDVILKRRATRRDSLGLAAIVGALVVPRGRGL